MITTLVPVLKDAQRLRYAVGAFNTNNLELSQAIIEAAVLENAPVIIQLSPKAMSYGGKPLFLLVKELAETAEVPVVIHLDHGKTMPDIETGLNWRMSSIMFDGSALTYEENLHQTKQVVRKAHRYKISVEGELGTIGGQEDRVSSKELIYPTANEVNNFAQESRVDALAVGLGTSHGLPVKGEHVDFLLLAEITKATKVPLVLHGASNLSPTTIRKAVHSGITKINIDTELRQVFTGAVRHQLAQKRNLYDLREYLGVAKEATIKRVQQKIKLFGSSNKANYAYSRFR